MKKIFILAILILVLTLTKYSSAQTGLKLSQTRSDAQQGELVKVSSGSYRNILSEQLWTMLQNKDFVMINVHIPYEGELPHTDVFIPYNQIEKSSGKLPSEKSAKIVLYCRSARMSTIAAETLVKLGYTNVWNLNEGMIEWKQKGFPLLDKRSN
jgi:rhodanese-related sulfurtransferase